MRAFELLQKHSLFPKIEKLFPELIETSKEITVIQWRDEFQVADKNPEVVDEMDFYELLLRNKMITEKEYHSHINKLLSQANYISRTEGVAFIETKEISFRSSNPHIAHIVHEIGHIHYAEPDPVWSAAHGGGEMLVQLALWKNYMTDDKAIRKYHSLIHLASVMPEKTAKEIAESIIEKTKLPCYPHLYAIQLFSGTIPDGLTRQCREKGLESLFNNLEDPKWEQIKVDYQGIRLFLTDILEGLKFEDSFSIAFAKAIELVYECPMCNKIPCICD